MREMRSILTHNPQGNYSFLPGGYPYSSGVVADHGFEIAHVTLRRPVPWRDGFARIDARLREAGRERPALCGVELRTLVPYIRAGFSRPICFLVACLLRQWMNIVKRGRKAGWSKDNTNVEGRKWGNGGSVTSSLAHPVLLFTKEVRHLTTRSRVVAGWAAGAVIAGLLAGCGPEKFEAKTTGGEEHMQRVEKGQPMYQPPAGAPVPGMGGGNSGGMTSPPGGTTAPPGPGGGGGR